MWRGRRSFLLPYRYGCLHELALARSRFCTRKRFTSFIRCEEQHRVLDAILHFFHSLFNPDGLRELIRAGGPPPICTIVFIEPGFFVGFFLPGDSLLVRAGILSAGGVIPLRWLLIPVMLCAIVGDQIGYWIGRSAGAALYRREDSLFFRRSHLQRAHDFYEKYGGGAGVISHFFSPFSTLFPPPPRGAKMVFRPYFCFRRFWWGFFVVALR